jgi:hypothetical protein
MMDNLYQTRPVQLTAVQWTGDNLEEVTVFAGASRINYAKDILQVRVTDGRWLSIIPGWWIARLDSNLGVHSDTTFSSFCEKVSV